MWTTGGHLSRYDMLHILRSAADLAQPNRFPHWSQVPADLGQLHTLVNDGWMVFVDGFVALTEKGEAACAETAR